MSEFSISGSNLSDVSRLLRQKPGVQSKDEFLNSAFMIKDKDKSKSLVMTPEEKAAYDKYQEERPSDNKKEHSTHMLYCTE